MAQHQFAVAEPAGDARGRHRREVLFKARSATGDGPCLMVVIHNLSETGALIEIPERLAPGETLEIEFPHGGPRQVRVVWTEEPLHGCVFHEPLTPAALSAALLRAGPQPRPYDDSHASASRSGRRRFSRSARLGTAIAAGAACWILLGCLAWALIR